MAKEKRLKNAVKSTDGKTQLKKDRKEIRVQISEKFAFLPSNVPCLVYNTQHESR